MRDVARRRKKANRGRSLLLAHRIELLEQAARQFESASLSVELESGASKASPVGMFPSDAVVATIQTMRGRRLEMWPRNAFGTIFVDEAHHATSASYRAVLDYFEGTKVLGVTATPDRGDGVALGGVIDHLAFEYNLRQAIEDGFLCPLRALAVDMPTVDLSSVRTTQQEHGRDLSAEDLSRVMMGEQQLHEMAGPIARESGDRSTIVFVPSVEIAHELARALGAYLGDARAEALDGGSSKQHRAEVLGRYQRGETRVLVNCALFTEGFDAPRTACVAIARPTKSRALYAQMIGRGTRLYHGKDHCLILDLAPANMRHALVAPVDLLLGKPLPDDELKAARAAMAGEDVLAALKKGEDAAKAKEEKRARDRGRIVADVAYRRIERDPFDELGIDVEMGADRGPVATEKQIVALANAGFKLSTPPTRRQASAIMDELTRRRQRGLCSVKQMRVLNEKGLRKDLSFDEARAAMDALVAAKWRVTPEIDERWGQRSDVDPAEDWER
ncbi:MAG TPA: DEAD/DEAH box helicase [Methyloceanibacter sp.]|nr:DEAD/DEAH box helicase [Methyloceanibacter sp.]